MKNSGYEESLLGIFLVPFVLIFWGISHYHNPPYVPSYNDRIWIENSFSMLQKSLSECNNWERSANVSRQSMAISYAVPWCGSREILRQTLFDNGWVVNAARGSDAPFCKDNYLAAIENERNQYFITIMTKSYRKDLCVASVS